MSSKKRRRLETHPNPPPLSAFAARKALQSNGSSPRPTHKLQEIDVQNLPTSNSPSINDTAAAKAQDQSLESETIVKAQQPEPSNGEAELDEIGQLCSIESRVESPEALVEVERSSIALSSFRPSKGNFKELADGALCIKLAPGERLIVLGQYKLSVKKGQVTLMGATLNASKTSYPIFALSSHSLPVIRCLATETDESEIILHQHLSGLETLGALSPLFANLGTYNLNSLSGRYQEILRKPGKSTFQILFSSEDSSQRTFVQPIISAPEWNAVLAKFSSSLVNERPPIIMICGPKSSGKSTFAKLLTNKLLLPQVDTQQSGVAVLDIDPGQPEYSPPGQLALLHIKEPNFGSPFTHPVPGPTSRIIHSHSIAALSPSMDTKHYMACIRNLISHYQHLRSTLPSCPLVINTPGWVLGTGLEILVELITKAKPTSIIYMSLDGPPEVISSLRDAAKATPVITVPSQVSEYTTRTAAHLRTMQYLSYFHLEPNIASGISWSEQPLTSIPPWEVRYSGEHAGILGVICYGEQPPPDLLADTINGSMVAVIVVDDTAAIPGWSQTMHEKSQNQDLSEPIAQRYAFAEVSNVEDLEEDSFQLQQMQAPLILPTPKEQIPYFNPANSITINPQHSRSIGLALIRGIDVTRQCLQILTPIHPRIIQEINDAGKSVILVSGKLDTPGWAYTEALNWKKNREKSEDDDNYMTLDSDGDDDKINIKGTDTPEKERLAEHDFENVPWVEKLEGSQGRGIGSRVWRVRRDLGKQDASE